MMDDEIAFSWDENKRLINLEKHKIDFRLAIRIFAGPVIVLEAASEVELRRKAIGSLNGVYVAVIYTIRGEVRRIISARRARHGEIRTYHDAYPR